MHGTMNLKKCKFSLTYLLQKHCLSIIYFSKLSQIKAVCRPTFRSKLLPRQAAAMCHALTLVQETRHGVHVPVRRTAFPVTTLCAVQ